MTIVPLYVTFNSLEVLLIDFLSIGHWFTVDKCSLFLIFL